MSLRSLFSEVGGVLELAGLEQLNKVWVDLSKALKVCEALVSKAEVSQGLSVKCKQAQQDLQSCCEKTDLCLADLGYVLKYKKNKQGEQVGVMAAKQIVEAAAGTLQELLDCGKALKALLPKT